MFTRIFLFILLLAAFSQLTQAQIVSGNSFIKGNYLELGVGPCGTYGSSVDAPAGYHPRGLFANRLGFVADANKDGWGVGTPNYCGDYFVPGTPEEGFGLQINGFNYNNNLLCQQVSIPGSIIDYNISGTNILTTWQGEIAGVQITSVTKVPMNDVFFITEVTLKNTTATTINNLYYMRNVDPDNEAAMPGGSFGTSNFIVAENPNSSSKALVSATGLAYGCYLGLGTKDCRARVTWGGFSNRNPSDVWNGTGGLSQSGSSTNDIAISIAFKINSLAPGESTTFKLAHVLAAADLERALDLTVPGLEVNGIQVTGNSTEEVCSDVTIPLHIANGSGFDWTWTPSSGLNTTTGTSVEATINSPTTYTATGTNSCGSASSLTITLNPTLNSSIGTIGDISGPAAVCLPSPNQTYSVDPVPNATLYEWTVPTGVSIIGGDGTNQITVSFSSSFSGDVTVKAKNACGVSNTSALSVSGATSITPNVNCPSNINVDAPAGQCGAEVNFAATGTGTISYSKLPGSFFAVGTTTVTATATTACGSASCSFTVTVNDKTNPIPVVTNLPDITAECSAIVSIVPTATDNCGETITGATSDALTYNTQGEHTIIWTYDDGNGNSVNQTQKVIIKDVTKPEISNCPSDILVYTGAGNTNCSQTATWTEPTATDNCSGPLTYFSRSHAPGSIFNVGETTVTYVFKDAAGNESSCSFKVTVVDDTKPVVNNTPADTPVYTGVGNTNCSQTATWTEPTATDNCSGPLTYFSRSHAPGSTFNIGTTTVTYVFKDAAGNESSCSFKVTVVDNTKPVVNNTLADIPVYTGVGNPNCSQTATWTEPTATDNCSGPLTYFSRSHAPGSTFNIGTTTVTYVFKDAAGNESSCSFKVTVVDNTKPVVNNTPADIPIYTGVGNLNCSQTATWTEPTATDNCSGPLTYSSRSHAPGSTFNVGETTVTYVFKDAAGNESSCSFKVTVVDNTKPVVNNTPADIPVYTGVGNTNCSQTATWTEPTATDNCSGPLTYFSRSHAPGSTFSVGTTIVTYTFKDGAGNQSTCNFNVIVIDNTKPVVVTKGTTKQLNSSGTATITAADVNNGSSDNCGISSMSVYPNTFNCNNIGNNQVTLTVTDIHGNLNTATATVTITALSTSSSVSVSSSTKQYSDKVTFTATLTPGTVAGGCQGAASVTFYVGTQNMETVPLSVASGNLTGSLTTALLEPAGASNGQMSPGNKTVKAVFSGINPAFTVNDATTLLTITPENAKPYYAGALYVSTSGSGSSIATVTLSATIKDITAEGSSNLAYDPDAGDIRNATITFINRDNNSEIKTVPIGLVNSSDLKTGTATYNWNVDIGTANSASYTIGIRVNNYYTCDNTVDNTVVTVSKPLDDFITGGGYLLLQSSAGVKAGDAGSKNNFGFNVKYNKSKTNLQGNINTIIRKTESGVVRVYQVKGNSMTSLSVNSAISSSHPYPTATFNGKASITDITNPLSPIPVDGGASLQVTMTDAGEPGSSDKIGITVWNKSGGLWYSSNWNGSTTVEKLLAGGNVVVRNGATATSSTVATVSVAAPRSDVAVKVSPNPAKNILNLQLYGYKGAVTIQLRNGAGKVFRQEKMEAFTGYAQRQLAIADLSSGLYFLTVIDSKGDRHTEKVIIAH